MADVESSNAVELLRYFHKTLGARFADLRDYRDSSTKHHSPVFALEHNLESGDLDLLKDAVRAAVRAGLGARHRAWWLPFVVYAAESGYDYVGDEYWHTFEQSTPGWRCEQRHWIKKWFQKFAEEYGGAVPIGAFASVFTIIAWPITHAVLPIYLQRNLAQLLFEFSGALTSELLNDPDALGIRLAWRASNYNYTERFRVFCENTALVGQVAAALLSGDNEPTPYLTGLTLARIVEGLSGEQQARHWLKSARVSASRVRGFRLGKLAGAAGANTKRLPRATDPRLVLRYDSEWNAFAELPDLTVLGAGLPEVYRQLQVSRAAVNGGGRSIPRSGLLYAGQEVHLARWPRPDAPFLQLERGDDETNRILSDQCVITKGPWWLFRRQGTGLAIEVKGKSVRPGHLYVLVGADCLSTPAVPWCTETAMGVQGIKGYELTVPSQLSESEESALVVAGLSVVSHVVIRPVGIVASAWDGEGDGEWLAGEPVMLGVRSDLAPRRARVAIEGAVCFFGWTPGDLELLFTLEELPVGTHELGVALLGDGDRHLASGSLVLTVRDPQVRPESGVAGEGIRMLVVPARPTLAELWDNRAVVTIDGPAGTEAELRASLFDGQGTVLAELHRTARVPLGETDWLAMAKSMRSDHRFRDVYDATESCVLTVARDGVGFATLTCERGFQPLRWRFSRSHDDDVTAMLVDRTDGGNTTLDFYDVEAPLTAVPKDPMKPLDVPTRGGLAIAKAGDAVAAVILPTNPNALLRLPRARPTISVRTASSTEVLRIAQGHRRWIEAELPADPLAKRQKQIVAEAITRAISTLISGKRWAAVECKLAEAKDALDYLDAMQDAVGVTKEHKTLASTIAYSLYKWLKPEDLLSGFYYVIEPHLARHGIIGKPSAPRFLLMLAGRPSYITEWGTNDAMFILDRVLTSPVLYRAARFAVLGVRALNDDEDAERGF